MQEKIKIIQFGCGNMAKYTARYAMEKGAQIVGAIDHNAKRRGRDAGEVLDLGHKLGIIVESDAEKVFNGTEADICIINTRSLMSDVYSQFEICAKHGINAISMCEESFFPWNSSPELTEKLDKLAKANDCTLTGSGYQDVFWGNLIAVIAGATHKIKEINGSSSYNLEDYGTATTKVHGAGLNMASFQREIASNKNIPAYMWNTNGWLCSKLGLNVRSQKQECIPTTHTMDLYSNALGTTIKAGYATGMSAVVTTETEEGITLKTRCIGKVYAPDEFDANSWEIIGEPSTTVRIDRPSTAELTCATVVNRIPQVINAPAGFYTTEKMAPANFISGPMYDHLLEQNEHGKK